MVDSSQEKPATSERLRDNVNRDVRGAYDSAAKAMKKMGLVDNGMAPTQKALETPKTEYPFPQAGKPGFDAKFTFGAGLSKPTLELGWSEKSGPNTTEKHRMYLNPYQSTQRNDASFQHYVDVVDDRSGNITSQKADLFTDGKPNFTPPLSQPGNTNPETAWDLVHHTELVQMQQKAEEMAKAHTKGIIARFFRR